MHELGDETGLTDLFDADAEDDPMFGWMTTGTCRLPNADELAAIFMEEDWLRIQS